MLFVPANRPELAAKAPRSAPDLVVLDLEDAVPPLEKVAARDGLVDAVEAAGGAGTAVAVRVNPVGSDWFDDDLRALPVGVAAVVVPKLDTAEAARRRRARTTSSSEGVNAWWASAT
jgi:citrate lyase subunit beta / citryl-CoA lyase